MSDNDTYHTALINDDSDEEDVSVTLGIAKSGSLVGSTMDIPKVLSMEDFNELKKKTLDLVDPEWKQSRNKELLAKMLALDSPSITPQMVEFLAQEDVCELLLNYVTQCDDALTRPTLKDEATPELKMGHKVTMLLTADDPSDGLKMLLSKRAAFITRLVMDIFDEKSAGSFYHAYRIVDLLVRFFPLEVLTALTSDGNLEERIVSMLRHLGCPPVAELMAMLVSLSSVSRDTELYASVAQARIEFIAELQEMDFLSKLVDVVVTPEAVCTATTDVPLEVHSQFACQLLQEVVEKLSVEHEGAGILEAFVMQSGQLERVLNTVTDPQARGFTRRNCSRMLDVLLRQASEPELMSVLGGGGAGMGAPQAVPNRLYPLREDIIDHLSSGFERLVHLVLTFEPAKDDLNGGSSLTLGGGENGRENFIYPTHTVPEPFSTLRVNFIDLVALLVESDETIANKIPAELWRRLIGWAVAYPQNNVFHSIFYRIVFSVLKQQQPHAQRVLFAQAGFVDFMVDNFLPLRSDGVEAVAAAGGEAAVVEWRTPAKDEDKALVGKYVMRGIILNCANACRLQALTQAPSSFLRGFLSESAKWRAFQPILAGASDMQRGFGLGISVQDGSRAYFHSSATLSEMMTDGEDSSHDGENSLGLGSHFAHNLGFYDDMCWDDLPLDEQEQRGYDATGAGSAGAGTPRGAAGVGEGEGDRDSVHSSGGGRDSLGSPGSGDRDSFGDRRNWHSGAGATFNRSPLAHSMYVPANLEEDESDVVDGILGPSSPAAQRIIEAGGSPQSGKRNSPEAGLAPSPPSEGLGQGEGDDDAGADAGADAGDGDDDDGGEEEDQGEAKGAAKVLDMDGAAGGDDGDGDGDDERGLARV